MKTERAVLERALAALRGIGAARPETTPTPSPEQEREPWTEQPQPGNRPATCAGSCYEVEPGVWIHHPWDGCTTTAGVTVAHVEAETVCWHCSGAKVCRCFCCAVLVAGGPSRWQAGACHVCRGTGTATVWVQ